MSERPVEHRIDTLCDECKAIDKDPRHHHTPDLVHLFSYCYGCATALGIYDYSDVIAAAENEGLSLIEYVTKEM